MQLKRHYAKPDGWVKQVDEQGNCTNPPPLSYVECHHTGVRPEQNFSDKLVRAGLMEGWIALDGKTLTLKVQPEPLRYTIKRLPGQYPVEGKPDQSEIIHHYECVLDGEQHDRFNHAAYVARKKGKV